MIKLNLQDSAPVRRYQLDRDGLFVRFDAMAPQFHRVVEDMSTLLERARDKNVYAPTELLRHAVDVLIPAERMGIMGAYYSGNRYTLGLLHDVTGNASHVHVQADPHKLGRALLRFEKLGLQLAGWIHSHPGTGPGATTPSDTDWAQYRDWTHDFGPLLMGMIVVRDGFVRIWGQAIDDDLLRLQLMGTGVNPVEGYSNVFKIDI